MNTNGDELYMKIVAFDEIYNFVVETFLFEIIVELKTSIYYPVNWDLDRISIFRVLRWLQMKKVWTTKL
jgi:hypothetical protein